MDKVLFPVSTKLAGKGDYIQNLIFILDGRINSEEIDDKFDESCGKIVGLSEYIKGNEHYNQNYLAIENIVGFSVSLKRYKDIVKEDRFSAIYSEMSKDLSIRKSRMSKD